MIKMNAIIPIPFFGKQTLIIILLSIFFTSSHGIAQEKKSAPVSFGFSLGLNHSTFRFDERSMSLNFPEFSQSKIGIGIGMVLDIPVIKNFSFQPEYMLNSIGGILKNLDADYRLNYLSFPIMVNWKVFPNLSIVAGPQFDLLINARMENEDGTSDVTKEIENRGVNAALGVQYDITKFLSLNGRYVHGLNHIGFIPQSGTPEFQSRLFQLFLIYNLSL